ncbi:Glu/Leu/Phe/Val dehydrogenase dimerisation region [Chthoniobacter flavus Ellin428]|uniref:Glu/Leu/Phe/Val dehydrogenase dimerisation region n=1 Tax=Chthoniobacter flavus Ellin428 TaxID=497964 RepID=B4CX71_9BACT|nr:Glu/Leu/Phe/Val dehydrogenase dimerization domain-containing protein [Chthoniobacter flavus]EDY20869.1 Glu/Leu/Phe/Val dehydrogenase dimerisation region [Chthoniobacter flavus Ellin428]TCO85639.1 leucine dehydrogenase [Chthoniobacter flavus]
MNVLTQITNADYERIQICRDEATGLHAIVAVHSTKLGPALGGVSMLPCKSEQEALSEVLRQSRRATFRAALAGLPFGGGAAVLIGDCRTQKTPAMLHSFARLVDDLGGKFLVTEGRGIEAADLAIIRGVTPHVASLYGYCDPSSFTAYSVFLGIVAAMKRVTGSEDLFGHRVLVQGVGRVGLPLVRQLCQAGATVYTCDIRDSALRAAVFAGARVVPLSALQSLMVDVYAPCATSAILNPTTIPQLRCSIVAGAADNPLLDEERDGQALHDRGILYVPDIVANAGGLIAISAETKDGYNPELAVRVARNIQQTATDVLSDSSMLGILPHRAAIRRAEMYLETAGAERVTWDRAQLRYPLNMPLPASSSSLESTALPPELLMGKEHLEFLRSQALNS